MYSAKNNSATISLGKYKVDKKEEKKVKNI